MNEFYLKQGDTFTRSVSVFSEDVPLDLSAATVRCQVRHGAGGLNPDELIQELTVVLLPPTDTGVFVLSATAIQTAVWPVGRHLADVQIAIGVGVQSTETFSIVVTRDVTR